MPIKNTKSEPGAVATGYWFGGLYRLYDPVATAPGSDFADPRGIASIVFPVSLRATHYLRVAVLAFTMCAMNFKLRPRLFVVVLAAGMTLFNLASCTSNPASGPGPEASSRKPILKNITSADVAKLRWIEGSWRGTGDIDKPFYERYKFENETTLAVESFDDDTFSKPTDLSRFELKDGEFGSTGPDGSRSAASAIDANSVTFEPVVKSRNSFRFQRESENSWKAMLTWPATDTTPAGQRNYLMERWPPAEK